MRLRRCDVVRGTFRIHRAQHKKKAGKHGIDVRSCWLTHLPACWLADAIIDEMERR